MLVGCQWAPVSDITFLDLWVRGDGRFRNFKKKIVGKIVLIRYKNLQKDYQVQQLARKFVWYRNLQKKWSKDKLDKDTGH